MLTSEDIAAGDTVGACADSAKAAEQGLASEYVHRLTGREQQLVSIRVRHQHLCAYLIAAAVAVVVVGYLALSSHVSPLWIFPPLSVLVSILRSLAKSARAHSRVEKIVNFYELGGARLRHQWQGRGLGGKHFLPGDHAYPSDLDLFGSGPSFELLCSARTGTGRAT